MRDILIAHSINNFSRICGSIGVKGFLSRFGFDNVYFASPDNHITEIDFVFYFEPWDNRNSSDEKTDKTEN